MKNRAVSGYAGAKFYNLAVGEIEEAFVDGDDKKSVLPFVIRLSSDFRG
ncbi:hypothetical protein [Kingella potus]|nr:hypothetical protein [Kingella potus]UOP00759.1 hypothetical protein LVJ84_13475 [Kingella potus]